MNDTGPAGAVTEVFSEYPGQARSVALALRRMIYEVAEREGVGRITETLKWGEPAYLTERTKLGSTIRIGWRPARPEECALFFICHTPLVAEFRALFEGVLRFEGDRAILLRLDEPLPKEPLETCIGLALTYHARKRQQDPSAHLRRRRTAGAGSMNEGNPKRRGSPSARQVSQLTLGSHRAG